MPETTRTSEEFYDLLTKAVGLIETLQAKIDELEEHIQELDEKITDFGTDYGLGFGLEN